jgi:hypothetical protein
MGARRLSTWSCAAAMMVSAGALAQEAAGKALWVNGKVERVSPDGAVRPLSRGETVRRHDIVRTAADSHAQLVMADEALIGLRPNTSLRIDEYRYAGPEQGGRAAFELMKGGLRSITGIIGRDDKSQYRLSTPTASIGIRGTDHETVVAEAGTYNRVTAGGTYLLSAHGRLDLAPGETGFAGSHMSGAPLRLDQTPEFMQLASIGAGRPVGPALREAAPSDQRLLKEPAQSHKEPAQSHEPKRANGLVSPRLPSQAIGDNASKHADRQSLLEEDKLKGWERFGKIKKNKP